MVQTSSYSRLFLSYARGDDDEPYDPATSFVARLHAELTNAGFDVWFDKGEVKGCHYWRGSITDGITDTP